MKADTYHHGNLKEELIEKGLSYIDQYGLEALSMRKLADSTGVSPAAPYAHFKNKKAFLTELDIDESHGKMFQSFPDSFGIREKLRSLFL